MSNNKRSEFYKVLEKTIKKVMANRKMEEKTMSLKMRTVKDFSERYQKNERYIQNIIKIIYPDLPKQGLKTQLTEEQSLAITKKMEKLVKVSLANIPTYWICREDLIKAFNDAVANPSAPLNTADQLSFSLNRIIEILLNAGLLK